MASNAVLVNKGDQSLRRLWLLINEGMASSGLITNSTPAFDPKGKFNAFDQSFFQGGTVTHGVVTGSMALAHCYRVQLDRGRIPVPCVLGTMGSHFAAGARPLTTLQPGTRVVVSQHPHTLFGTIIACIRPAGITGKRQLAQQITHSSRNRVDDVHKEPHRTAGDGFIYDWLAGGPFDSLMVGEQGWIAETGMRCFIDSFMALFGLDEGCSLQVFYHDQMVRLMAVNFRHYTAGYAHESLDDQGEIHDWEGWAPYPWEQLGLFERGNPFVEKTSQQWQLDEPHYGPVEPADDKLRAWHRERRFHGYLGQGGSYLVQTKPASGDKALYTPDGDQPVYPGLFKQHVGLDGMLTIQTAKGFSIVKRIACLAPAQKYVPEQTVVNEEGDSDSNYRAGGHPDQGGGPEHKITGGPEATADAPNMQKAAGVLDLHAYLFNYATVHPFVYHEKDWDVADESELEHTGGKVIDLPPFSMLGSNMFLRPGIDFATAQKIAIDHRYADQEYFPNEAGMTVTDDGSVVIFGGCGEEIRLAGGHVYITAPGDTYLLPGRTLNLWGGDDVIVRAKNSMDFTVSEKDIRFKAEKNIQMLAGNGGEEGGLLLESRASSEQYNFDEAGEKVKSAGIMLRCDNAPVIGWAKDIYLRSGPAGEIPTGNIILDAGKGQGELVVHSLRQHHYTASDVNLYWGTEGEVNRADKFSQSTHDFCSQVFIDGRMALNGDICARGPVLLTTGAFISPTNPDVIEPDADALQKCEDEIEEGSNRVADEYVNDGEDIYESKLEEPVYATEKKGNDEVIRKAKTTLRTEEDYGTDSLTPGWQLYESRWQQLARIGGGSGPMWEEKAVTFENGETYPYPGKTFYEGSSLYQQDLQIFDASSGNPFGRGSGAELSGLYLEPRYATPSPVSLNQYQVVR